MTGRYLTPNQLNAMVAPITPAELATAKQAAPARRLRVAFVPMHRTPEKLSQWILATLRGRKYYHHKREEAEHKAKVEKKPIKMKNVRDIFYSPSKKVRFPTCVSATNLHHQW